MTLKSKATKQDDGSYNIEVVCHAKRKQYVLRKNVPVELLRELQKAEYGQAKQVCEKHGVHVTDPQAEAISQFAK